MEELPTYEKVLVALVAVLMVAAVIVSALTVRYLWSGAEAEGVVGENWADASRP